MPSESDIFLQKVELIMESPTERNKYIGLASFSDKLSFLRNHFIMKEMELRLLERKYLLSESKQEELVSLIEGIIKKLEA